MGQAWWVVLFLASLGHEGVQAGQDLVFPWLGAPEAPQALLPKEPPAASWTLDTGPRLREEAKALRI